jgi:hypothetical protein
VHYRSWKLAEGPVKVIVAGALRPPKAIRKSAASEEEMTVSVSEILPAHDQLWLPDAQGNRYSCELRTVALDLEPVDGGVL